MGTDPGTRPIPEVGFLKFLKHSLEILRNPLPFHHGNFERLGDTFRLRLGRKRTVVFSRDPALLEYALQKNWKNFTKTSIQTRDLARYLGMGLLTSEGELWRTQRKLIQPGFHKKELDAFYQSMESTVQKELAGFPAGGQPDVYPLFGKLAFRVVVESLFSGAVSEAEIGMLQHSTEANQQMLVRELRQPYLHWYFERFGVIRRHLELTRQSREILRALIRKRQADGGRKGDLLDMLLEARYEDGSAMAEDQLIDEILVLFVAGHETTANALSFTAQLLALHPQWQEAIRAEAGGPPGTGAVTQQIIEESMRLYPPAYFIDRMNLEADQFAGYRLPQRTDLLFSVYEIHRHPEHWEQPQAFRPERFAPDAPEQPRFYYPFGAGPRKCIGAYFAMTEMKMVLQGLLSSFDLAAASPEIRIHPLITLKPRDARVQLTRR